jgi:hypothetical protein
MLDYLNTLTGWFPELGPSDMRSKDLQRFEGLSHSPRPLGHIHTPILLLQVSLTLPQYRKINEKPRTCGILTISVVAAVIGIPDPVTPCCSGRGAAPFACRRHGRVLTLGMSIVLRKCVWPTPFYPQRTTGPVCGLKIECTGCSPRETTPMTSVHVVLDELRVLHKSTR